LRGPLKLTLRAITLTLLLLAAAATASAGTVTLTIDNGGSNVSGGVYVGPYNFTSGGQSLQLICDAFQNDVSPPETWTANMTVLGSGTGLFGSTSSAQYQQVGWLAQQMLANLSNPTLVAEIQWAIWDIFDAGSCTTGVSNCDPYGTPDNQSAINALVTGAENPANYATGNYSNLVVYTPVSGWPAGDGTPQEYIGLVTAPEPGSLLLIGAGLFSLLVFRRRLSY
jgi:PEP-CTERM motif-containing protein